jgi:DNA-binding MarR family transcriptional regulator
MATTAVTEEQCERVLPPGDAGLDAWRRLIVANSRLLSELDEELREAHGITLGDYDVLVNLAAVPGRRMRMCSLAEAVLLSPSGLSRRIDRLERGGLVARERATTDARNIEAALTPAGSRFLRKARTTHLAGVEERFMSNFSTEELETLRDLLGRLTVDRFG